VSDLKTICTQFAEEPALGSETDVVCIKKFLITRDWEIICVQVEQDWGEYRTSWEAISLRSPGAGVSAHVHPEAPIS